jgi:hypothetical protein
MAHVDSDVDSRLNNLENKLRDIESGVSVPKWFSSREIWVIKSGIILMISCVIVLAYLAIFGEISIDDKLVVIITTILGYLFGYLPLKESEISALKKSEDSRSKLDESINILKSLEGRMKAYDETEKALKRELERSKLENEELKKTKEKFEAILREIAASEGN